MNKKKKLTKDQEHRKFIEGRLKSMPDSPLKKSIEENYNLLENGRKLRNILPCIDETIDKVNKETDSKEIKELTSNSNVINLMLGSFLEFSFNMAKDIIKNKDKL